MATYTFKIHDKLDAYMENQLTGNVLVAQSGGPTSVINASLAGVITESLNHDCIEEIYGGLNGIEGILKEQLIDLAEESQQTVRGLRYTPSSALGTCRYKLKSEQDFARFIDVCKAHNIRFFFYIGGNDSQDTANKIAQHAASQNYEMRVIGIPKTIDNDLTMTDHCPGYGSVVKYLCTTIRELALDHEAMGNHDLVSIVEVMGRDAGWIAAGTSIAKRRNQVDDPPHIILLPEVAFNPEYFLAQVQECLKKNKYCLVVVSEGICDANGNLVSDSSSFYGRVISLKDLTSASGSTAISWGASGVNISGLNTYSYASMVSALKSAQGKEGSAEVYDGAGNTSKIVSVTSTNRPIAADATVEKYSLCKWFRVEPMLGSEESEGLAWGFYAGHGELSAQDGRQPAAAGRECGTKGKDRVPHGPEVRDIQGHCVEDGFHRREGSRGDGSRDKEIAGRGRTAGPGRPGYGMGPAQEKGSGPYA